MKNESFCVFFLTELTSFCLLTSAFSLLRSAMVFSRRTLLGTIAFVAVHAFAAEPPDPKGAEFYEKRIQPILSRHCYKCHSHSGEKIKGGLVLDSAEGLLGGGDSGPAVVPGDPEKSLLIEAIRYGNEDLQMPPKGKKLTDEQIATLTEWVKIGAPWPTVSGRKISRGAITE